MDLFAGDDINFDAVLEAGGDVGGVDDFEADLVDASDLEEELGLSGGGDLKDAAGAVGAFADGPDVVLDGGLGVEAQGGIQDEDVEGFCLHAVLGEGGFARGAGLDLGGGAGVGGAGAESLNGQLALERVVALDNKAGGVGSALIDRGINDVEGCVFVGGKDGTFERDGLAGGELVAAVGCFTQAKDGQIDAAAVGEDDGVGFFSTDADILEFDEALAGADAGGVAVSGDGEDIRVVAGIIAGDLDFGFVAAEAFGGVADLDDDLFGGVFDGRGAGKGDAIRKDEHKVSGASDDNICDRQRQLTDVRDRDGLRHRLAEFNIAEVQTDVFVGNHLDAGAGASGDNRYQKCWVFLVIIFDNDVAAVWDAIGGRINNAHLICFVGFKGDIDGGDIIEKLERDILRSVHVWIPRNAFDKKITCTNIFNGEPCVGGFPEADGAEGNLAGFGADLTFEGCCDVVVAATSQEEQAAKERRRPTRQDQGIHNHHDPSTSFRRDAQNRLGGSLGVRADMTVRCDSMPRILEGFKG